jgi:DNA-binding transcriptional ArsR family regulator
LKREDGARGPSQMRGLALSENDADILSFLSHRPCSIRSQIASAMSLSPASIKWHLRKLVKAELLATRDFKGHTAHYPVGMLRDDEFGIFALLAYEDMREALKAVAGSPGLAQDGFSQKLGFSRQTVSRVVRELGKAGIVVSARDGRSVRYYPSDTLSISGEAYADRRKTLLDGTISKLSMLGLQPKVIKSDPAEIYVMIGAKGRQTTLRFGLNPYVTCLW